MTGYGSGHDKLFDFTFDWGRIGRWIINETFHRSRTPRVCLAAPNIPDAKIFYFSNFLSFELGRMVFVLELFRSNASVALHSDILRIRYLCGWNNVWILMVLSNSFNVDVCWMDDIMFKFEWIVLEWIVSYKFINHINLYRSVNRCKILIRIFHSYEAIFCFIGAC